MLNFRHGRYDTGTEYRFWYIATRDRVCANRFAPEEARLLQTTADLALRAAGYVGAWTADVSAGQSLLDEGTAALLAGDATLAGRPLPIEIALRCTHPDDRDWVFARIARVRQTGGPVSAEYRVLTDGGEVRWVLDRGSLTPDLAGRMRGRGIIIDTTDSHRGPFLPSAASDLPADDPMVLAVDHLLQARAAIVAMGHQRLQQVSDLALFEVGRALARRARA
ncbi:PAS domain-containing protein [Methylobacterium sp. NPDC080182]|uniref:PAS domain-containing protein n=1 Tax=Methylobacterium sp. NPDC080182 TaxID=3390590 RepID=UPI003CFFB1E7